MAHCSKCGEKVKSLAELFKHKAEEHPEDEILILPKNNRLGEQETSLYNKWLEKQRKGERKEQEPWISQ